MCFGSMNKLRNSKKGEEDLDKQFAAITKVLERAHRDRARELEARRNRMQQFSRIAAEARRKLPKRDLSQLHFQGQHWWTTHRKKREEMTIDAEKAALIYEGFRRRPEVQQAWLEGNDLIGANGWQPFVGFAVMHLPKSWAELHEITQVTLLEEIHSPLFVPPRGYSTFPDKSSPEQCREAAMQVLRLPPPDDPELAQAFVKHARRFVDAGFLIVAVDNKTGQGVRYAAEAIQRLQRSFRKADMVDVEVAYIPDDLPQTECDALEKKRQDGTLTVHDISEAWSRSEQRRDEKHIRTRFASGKSLAEINEEDWTKQIIQAETGDGWHPLVQCETRVTDKRERRRGPQVELIELKRFDFPRICRELEDLDAGKIAHSEFVQRLRLS